MNITLFIEYVRGFAWSSTAWSAVLARALAAHGHHVTVACDGLEDPSIFAGVGLRVRRPHRTLRGGDPLGFLAWARDVARECAHDVTISLTPLVPGDLWLPLGHSTLGTLVPSLRSHAPASGVLELLARPWLPLAVLAESKARRVHSHERAPILAQLGTLSGGPNVHALGYASRFPRFDQEQRIALRARARELLGISPDRPVGVLSAVHSGRPGLQTMLGGFAGLRRRGVVNPPLLLVVGRRAHGVHQQGEQMGCADGLRFLGATARVDAVLAAADVAIAPWSASLGPTTGRFIADSLRLGVPVVAHRDAPGAELVRPAHFGTPEVGTLVEQANAHQWQEAMGVFFTRDRHASEQRAARDISEVVSIEGMVRRIEALLKQVNRSS